MFCGLEIKATKIFVILIMEVAAKIYVRWKKRDHTLLFLMLMIILKNI